MKILTVGLEDWEVQTNIVSSLNDRDDGYLDGLLVWMEELKRHLDSDPVIVATPGQAKWLRKLQNNLSIQVVTPPPFPDGKKLTGVRVLGKDYFPDGQLRSVSIRWEGEEDLTEEDLADD